MNSKVSVLNTDTFNVFSLDIYNFLCIHNNVKIKNYKQIKIQES